MRPSNSEIAKGIAGEVVTETFVVLAELGYTLGIQEMRFLMDRVEARLQRGATAKGAANGKEARS